MERKKPFGFFATLRNFQDPASPLSTYPLLSDRWYNLHRIFLLAIGLWYLFFFVQYLKGNVTFSHEKLPLHWVFIDEKCEFLFFPIMTLLTLFYIVAYIFCLISFLVPDNKFIDTCTRLMSGFHSLFWLLHLVFLS